MECPQTYRLSSIPRSISWEEVGVVEARASRGAGAQGRAFTAFPLAASVGEALVDYLRNGGPQIEERRVFFRAVAPVEPIGPAAVSARARHY
ncbi:MAG: hypothetical protein LC720_08490 [Actinobacteria bacterium]|nr:hypothetical protein [Actinomycetota bacterium]